MNQRISFSLKTLTMTAESLCLLALACLLLWVPRQTAFGVTQGLRLCFSSLIGAMLPFLVVSKLFVLRGLHRHPALRRSLFTTRLLQLPGACAAVFPFSMIGGYPVGASMAAQLAKEGQISERQAQQLMLFCFGPGPSYLISAVGAGMLQSRKAGMVLYGSVVGGAMVTGLLTRLFYRTDKTAKGSHEREWNRLPFAAALNSAADESIQATLLICGFVALFSACLQILSALQLPQQVQLLAAALLEVTNACSLLSLHVSLPVLAAITAWGGCCTHCQISAFLGSVHLKFFRFLGFRALHAGCSFLFCKGLLRFVKLPVGVFEPASRLHLAAQPNGLLSVCMIILCVLLLFGSRATIVFSREK